MSGWRKRTQAAMLSSRGIVSVLFIMIALPASLTLRTVRVPAKVLVSTADPTPHGYTWSLLLFVVPILVISLWFLPMERICFPAQPFWITISVLSPIGFTLDFCFAKLFFCFNNPKATLGIRVPALGNRVPVEEYLFYLSGFVAILLLYIWLDEYWLQLYRLPEYRQMTKAVRKLTRFHSTSLFLGLGLIVAGYLYRSHHKSAVPGFPGYWTFLVATAIVPSAALFPEVKRFINWRALSFTLFLVLLISLFWEATLAIPYQWWGYNPSQMIGLSIGAWSGLPIEAVCLWVAVSYATVIVFEAIRVWSYSGRKAKEIFVFGTA